MSQLEDDLAKDWQAMTGKLNKGDVIEGFLILMGIGTELAAVIGLVMGVMVVASHLTGGLAALGLPLAVGPIQIACVQASKKIVGEYANLSKRKRKALISALKFIGIHVSVFEISQ